MLQGITFDKQKMKSEDMAHITNMFFQGKEGVTKGCNISTDSNGDIVISEGYFSVQGRLVKNVGNTIVEVPTVQSGVLYSVLVFEVDLSKENEQELFKQGQFKVISNASTYPALTKQDLENGGTIYQLEFCRFENTTTGITNLVDRRSIFDLEMYALNDDLDSVEQDVATLKGTTQTITYYVSPTGNDSNNGLSTSAAFRTIQHAINKLPKRLNHNITINLVAGDYSSQGDININGFYGVGKLFIVGNSTNPNSYVLDNLKLRNVSVEVELSGVYPKGLVSTAIDIYNCSFVRVISTNILEWIDQIGINAISSTVYIYNCTINYRTKAIASDIGSVVMSHTNWGANNEISLYAVNGGTIGKYNSQPTGVVNEQILAGGVIR